MDNNQYKKFLELKKKKLNEDGQVQESQQKQYQAKDYFGKGSNAGNSPSTSNAMGISMSDGGDVPSSSANTASSLSPLLKEQYAKFSKKKVEHMSTGGWAPEQMAKPLKNPLQLPDLKQTLEKKYAINIPKAPKIKIPKRLRPIDIVKGYAEGGNVMDLGDIPMDSGPYPGEEAAAHEVVDNSTQGQIQHELDDNEINKIVDMLPPPSKSETPKEEAFDMEEKSKDQSKVLQPMSDKETKDPGKDKEYEEQDKDFEEKPTDQSKVLQPMKTGEDEPKLGEVTKDPEKLAEQVPEKPLDEEVKPSAPEEYSPMQALKDAQEHQRQSTLWNTIGGILDRGAAQYGGYAPTQQEAYKQNIENAGLPVKQLEQQLAMEKYDPNSGLSKAFKQYMVKFGGKDALPPGVPITADMGEKLIPYVFKDKESQMAAQAKLAEIKQRSEDNLIKTREIISGRENVAKMGADAKALAREEKANNDKEKKEQKIEEQKDKVALQTGQLLEQMRGSPAVSQAEKDIYAAQKANSLATLYKDPNMLNPQQVRLLSTEVAKIASGGAPTMEELKGITPDTFRGKLASVVQKLTNSPSPAHAADFIKQFQDYSNTLTKDAQKVIKDRYGRIIEPRKKQLGDEHYNDLMERYTKRFDAIPDEQTKPTTPTKDIQGFDPDAFLKGNK